MHLEMQMRSHCAAGMPHIGNDLPGFDLLAHRDTDAGAVRVPSSQPAAVVQLDVVTVTAAPTVQPVGDGHVPPAAAKRPAWLGVELLPLSFSADSFPPRFSASALSFSLLSSFSRKLIH